MGAPVARVRTVAKQLFGWTTLRPGIEDAIRALLDGRDALAVMPTGHGKSAIYQVAGALLDGPTVVVSPLIALQRDQVAGLADVEGARGVTVNSAQSGSDTADAWRAVHDGEAEFLFLSPEQLAKDEVVERVRSLGVSLFVVDEAHCVTSWGHDFRPDYLRLGGVIERLGHPTVVALTATAAPPVQQDVVTRLGLRDPLLVVRGFDRPNLHLDVVRHVEDGAKRDAVVQQVAGLDGAGLVYVATRKDTARYSQALADRGLRAAAYHAGLRVAERRQAHERFSAGEVDVVVATSAFGMGIDKSDVRFVVHADVPDSIDSYYQEIGRAGRDGEHARAVLHYRSEDLGLRRFFASGSADTDALAAVFSTLQDAGGPMRITALREACGLAARTATGVVNQLEDARVVTSGRRGVRAVPELSTDEAVQRAVEIAESRRRVEGSRLEMMRGYAETTGCRRQYLLGYFGERLDEPCGACDTCDRGTAYDVTGGPDSVDEDFPLQAHVRHAEWGPGVVMSHEQDRLTVLFEQEGYRTLSREAIASGDLLTVVSSP